MNYCIFCTSFCNGTCEEWDNLTNIMNNIIEDYEQTPKKKRRYKNREELMSSEYVSDKCLECRIHRQVCDKKNICERCSRSKKRECLYDYRLQNIIYN